VVKRLAGPLFLPERSRMLSMQKEIIWFTTHPPNVETLNRFFSAHNLEISAFCSPIEEMYDSIRRCVADEGTKVAIIRGGFGPEIKRNITSIPVVNVNQTVIDFYNLFPRIESMSKQAALVGWYSNVRGLRQFLKETSTNIQYVDLEDCGFTAYAERVKEILLKLKEEGVDLIVSGGAVINIAAQYGLKTLYVGLLDDQAILNAAAEAQYQLRLLKEQESRYDFINSIFNCISEGIIAVNPNWEITNMNPIAARMLGVQTSEWHGIPLENYLGIAGIRSELHQRGSIENQVISIADKRLVLSAVPSVIHGQNAGVVVTLQQVETVHSIEKKLRSISVENGMLAQKGLKDIIGSSPKIEALKKKAIRYAVTDSTVLITGESGVGKELFAQGIHNRSPRRNAPFVAINCAALPENLLESELFGYVRGAFTGARNEGKAGVFELANTGTIFLDEISEISPQVQARLLRVLQERNIVRIGDSRIVPLDVRIIAATNRDLKEQILTSRFRQDLYYRLCVLPLHVMPLRERRSDILEIIYHLLRSKTKRDLRFSEAAEKMLTEYDWPGNVRELTNFVERILVLYDQNELREKEVEEALFVDGGESNIAAPRRMEVLSLADKETLDQELIWQALQNHNWNRKQAAHSLGISTTTLWRKMKKLGFISE